MRGRVLVIAGSDSGGGAGIQADIKTITAFAVYAATAITALTAQDTDGVRAVHVPPADFLRLQIAMALADPGADVVKTGMLGDAERISLVADLLGDAGLPVVVDPVMVAKGGASLIADDAVGVLREQLLPLAALLTPNVPEAERLSGLAIADEAGQLRAAERLRDMGAAAVLLKGGHMPGAVVVDLLLTASGCERLVRPRLVTRHTHGTGCTFASAIAAGLARGDDLSAATAKARAYVQAAIATAPGIGAGHGPLNHAVREPV